MKLLQAVQGLRWPLSLLLGAMVLALAAGYVRMRDEERIERLRDDIQEMQFLLQERMTKQHLGRRMQRPFEMLVRAGFLDPVSARPAWVQSLARALEDAHVLKAGFNMQSAMPIQDTQLESAGYRLTLQPVTVAMQLAHEGDLVAFLKRVLQRPVGVVKNRYCIVTSAMDTGKVFLEGPNLQARCRFDWYALEQVSGLGDGDMAVEDVDESGEPL